MTRILTPDSQLYLRAAVIVAGAGSVALASQVHVRWLDRRGWPAIVVHALVLALLAVLGVAVFGLGPLSRAGWLPAVLAAVAGIPAGFAVSAADGWLTRRLSRRPAPPAARRPAAPSGPPRAGTTSRMRATPLARGLAGGVAYQASPAAWTPTARDRAVPTQLGWLLLAAVAEECLFRGVLTTTAWQLPWWPARGAALVAVVAGFCLSHLYFGWAQVAAKAPLSLATTAIVLLAGGITGAVVLHATVNARVWWRSRPRADRPRAGWPGAGRPGTNRPAPSRTARAGVPVPASGGGR